MSVPQGTLFGEDYEEALRILGDVCGVSDRAEEVITFINTCLEDEEILTQEIPYDNKPTVLGAGATFKGGHSIDGIYTNYPVFEVLSANDVATDVAGEANSSGVMVDKEQILYGILLVLLYTVILEKVSVMGHSKVQVKILSEKNDDIRRIILRVLDETVGPACWQREHYECKGNLFCRVGINVNYDKSDREERWVWKSDCGTESNTEAQKGEASDSFKRACVNWGIGRELYTSPFIWVPASDKDGKPNYNTDNRGKPKLVLTVIELETDDGKIKTLSICNGKKLVYHWGGRK